MIALWSLALWSLPPAAAADPEALLHLARERMRHGDFEGVRTLTDQALAVPGDHQRAAQYLEAMAWELGGDPSAAIAIYDALVEAYAADEVPDDLRFRRAECLGRLGEIRSARAELARLPTVDRPPADQLKIDVLTGTWALALGHRRRAYRTLVDALSAAGPADATRYQAIARHTLLTDALDTAATLTFEGSDRRKARALRTRAGLIQAADDQLAQLIPTNEADLVLDGFLELGRAYGALGRDMLAESPLNRLTETQREINRALLEERVAKVWTRGTLYYDRAIGLAARLDWTGPPAPTLRTEHGALLDAVDTLELNASEPPSPAGSPAPGP